MTVKNLKYLWLGHLYRAGDIDVWIAINPENAKKVVEAIKEFGFNDPDLSEDIFLKEDKVIRKVASRSEEAETTAFYYIGSVIKQHLMLFLARLGLTFVPAEPTIDGAWRKAGALLKFIGKIEFSVQIWRVGSTAPINPDQFEDVVIIEEQALAVYLNLGNGFLLRNTECSPATAGYSAGFASGEAPPQVRECNLSYARLSLQKPD